MLVWRDVTVDVDADICWCVDVMLLLHYARWCQRGMNQSGAPITHNDSEVRKQILNDYK